MPTTILLMDANEKRGLTIGQTLMKASYSVSTISHIKQLPAKLNRQHSNILIISLDHPDQLSASSLKDILYHYPCTTLVLVDEDSPEAMERIIEAGANAYVSNNADLERLPTIIRTAQVRFRLHQNVQKELEETQVRLKERKLIDRAKGLLMTHKGISEDEAYQCLRKMAMDKGMTMGQLSNQVIEAAQLLDAQTDEGVSNATKGVINTKRMHY